MMKKYILSLLVLSAISTTTFAEENGDASAPAVTSSSKVFIGGDIGSVSGYPNTTGVIVNGLAALGWTSASASQGLGSTSVNIHGGKWLSEVMGWEVGYSKFGDASGSFNASAGTQAYYGSNIYSASSIYAAILGAAKMGSGKAYAKVGLHSTATKTDYTSYRTSSSVLVATSTGSTTKSNSGIVLGVGYEYPFNNSWAIRADITMFTAAQFANVWNFATTENQTLIQSGIGLNYNY